MEVSDRFSADIIGGNKMKYGVVIVTYNRLELLKECVEQCLNQTVPFERIVIVNNCSTDGTKEYLEQYNENPEFVISNQTENLGGAGGFRVGLALAQQEDLDWILIIDDDAMIASDYIRQCDKIIRRRPNMVACSGTVYTEGKIQTSHRRVIVNQLLCLEKNVPLSAYEQKSFHYDLATFCGLMVRGDILRKIGLPKSEYFIWYDDTEYSMRLRQYGGIVNINAAHLNHKTVLPTGKQAGFFARMSWRTYYGHRNRLDAVKAHCKPVTTAVIIAEFFVFIACGYGMQLIPSKRKQGRYIARMLRDALKDGYHGVLGKNEKYSPN